MELSASLIRNPAGEPCAFIAMVRDITERKRAAEAQRETEERYRILYQDNPSMYFTVDADGTVLSVNQFGAEQLGYEVASCWGNRCWACSSRRTSRTSRSNWLFASASGEVHHWEFRKVRKDGASSG